MSLTITEAAKIHFSNLINKQPRSLLKNKRQLNLRIQAIDPGTTSANIELCYCPYGEQHSSDVAIDCGYFMLYVDRDSQQPLFNAVIDYQDKLSIKAPYLKLPNQHDTSFSYFDKITNFLTAEINPILARHGGMVKLIEISESNKEITLQFSGGCKGCSMVDFTLKHNIEKSLKAKFPEITTIKDITNHTDDQNAFYK